MAVELVSVVDEYIVEAGKQPQLMYEQGFGSIEGAERQKWGGVAVNWIEHQQQMGEVDAALQGSFEQLAAVVGGWNQEKPMLPGQEQKEQEEQEEQ